MTNKEKAEYLREHGLSYEAIGKLLGVSRQRVEQIIHAGVSNRVSLGKNVIYPNLLAWSIDNKCSRGQLLRRMGYTEDTGNKAKLYRVLTGKHSPNKDYIDKMLQATGLSYEKLFEVKQNDEVQG